MKNLLLPLAALYAVLAASSAAVVTPLGYAWYGTGMLWIAVTGVTQFLFAFALERRTPKSFVWVVLGGGFLRMLLAAATAVGVNAAYHEVITDAGHDGFLLPDTGLSVRLHAFLG